MHPLLLLLFPYFLLSPPAASAADSSGCWPKACGDLNITYPFWLDEPGKPPCGPPSFKLKCNSSGAFLTRSIYQAFQVLSIFTNDRSFHVVDHNLPLVTGCPAPTMNISLFSPTFVFRRTNKDLFFLGKCTTWCPPAESAGFHSLHCDKSSFVRLGNGRDFSSHGIQGGIPQGCSSVSCRFSGFQMEMRTTTGVIGCSNGFGPGRRGGAGRFEMGQNRTGTRVWLTKRQWYRMSGSVIGCLHGPFA